MLAAVFAHVNSDPAPPSQCPRAGPCCVELCSVRAWLGLSLAVREVSSSVWLVELIENGF